MLKQSSLCWKSDFIAEPSIPQLTVQNSRSNNPEQLRWGEKIKRASQALEAVKPQRVSQRCSESFQVSSNTKMLNMDTMERGQQLLHICAVLPMLVIIAEAGTLRRFLVSFIVSGLAFLIRTTKTDLSRRVSNKHWFQHLHGVYSKWVVLYIISFPEGGYHL